MSRVLWAVLLLLPAAGSAGAQGWEDRFEGKTLNARWTWRVPVAGPRMALLGKGGVRITIPERDDGFNHWNEPKLVDEAPQLRAAAPDGDWELEARIHLQQFDADSHFMAGVMVGTSDSWLLTVGAVQAPNLPGPKTPEPWLEFTGASGFVKLTGDARDLRLRLTRTGAICRASVCRKGDEWEPAGAVVLPAAPQFVGILGKTFSPGPAVSFDVEYVRVRPLPAPKPAGRRLLVGIGGTYPTGWRGMLARQGIPHEVLLDYQLTDVQTLRRFDLLFIGAMNGGGIELQGRPALMEYVRGGGIAVLDSNVLPTPAVVAGQGGQTRGEYIPDTLIGGENNPLLPLVGKNTRLKPGESWFCFKPESEAGLQVFARFDGNVTIGGKPKPAQGYTGTPAVWAHPLGKGLFIYSAPSIGASLSWGPTLDPLAEALVRLLCGSRLPPQLVPEGVRLGRKETALSPPAPSAPASPAEFTRPTLTVAPAALPRDAELLEEEPAPEYNVTGTYAPRQGRARLLLNYWNGHYQVTLLFEPGRARLARLENNRTVARAEMPLPTGDCPFLVKERRGQIQLLAGGREVSLRAGGLWAGKLARIGNALGDVRYQPVDRPHLSDDFVRTEGEQGAWSIASGEWNVKAEGDPKMGVNPFSYHGQAKGDGLSLVGQRFWDDYSFGVSVRPTAPGTVGQVFYYQDDKNHLLFRARVCDTPLQAKDGFELVRVQDGKATVLARGDGSLVAGHWYRLSARAQEGALSAWVDGERVVGAEDKTFAGGKAGLYLHDCRAEFDDVDVLPVAEANRPASVELDGSVPPFAGTLDRDTWAGTALQWEADHATPGLFWRRGRLYGDFELAFRCNFADKPGGAGDAAPPAMTLLLAADAGAADAGYGLSIRPAAPGSFTVALLRQRAVLKRADVKAGERPVVELRRAGARLLGLVDGRQVVECAAVEAPGQLSRIGFQAAGFLPRLSGMRLDARSVLDYCFDRAPTDWWVTSGNWQISSRWPCTPEWSWFGGQSDQVAAIWHKRQFTGDVLLDAHVGPASVKHSEGGGAHEICRAFNVTLCGDGQDVRSGYSFVLGADKAGAGATLSRNGKVVARNDAYRIYSDAHNQWLNVRAEKQGPQVTLWVGDQEILSFRDTDPLPGGRIGIWTEDNGIMIPRATIYHREPLGPVMTAGR